MNKIQHIGLCVLDIDKTVDWYSKWFGFKEVKRFEKAEFEMNGALIMLGDQAIEILAPKRPIEKKSTGSGIVETLRYLGLNHISISVDDVGMFYEKFKEEGFSMISYIIDGRFFFCKDPDGNVLEIRAN